MRICPKCGCTRVTSVEYRHPHPCSYDGTSEYRCDGCGYRQGRWSGAELKEGRHEPVYGAAHVKSCPDHVPLPVARVVSRG